MGRDGEIKRRGQSSDYQKDHIIHLKYINFLFVHYVSIKVEKKMLAFLNVQYLD